MYKKWRFIFTIVILALITTILISNNNNGENHYDNTDILTFYNYETDRELLNKLYITSDNSSYFLTSSQYNTYSSYFSLPMLYYYMEFKTIILAEKVDSEIVPQIKKFTNNYINELAFSEEISPSDYQEIYFLSTIDSIIGNIDNNDFYFSYARKILDENIHLNDLYQCFSLRMVLGILNNIENLPDEYQILICDRLNTFFINENYFTASSGFRSDDMFPIEIELLYTSNIFNELSKEHHIELDKYKTWYEKEIVKFSYMLSDQVDSFILSSVVINLKSLNELYSLEFNHDSYVSFIDKLKSINFNNIIFNDYVFVYQSLLILSYENNNIISTYYDNINNFKNFIFIHANFADLREQYFGLLLAENLDQNINKETYLNYINLNANYDINSAYYYCLIYAKLNKVIDEAKEMAGFLDKKLKDLENLTLKEIYFLMHISDFLNLPLNAQIQLEIKEIIDEKLINYETEEYFFFYLLIKEKLNLKLDKAWIIKNIESYYLDGYNFSYIKNDKNYCNIMSTFRMVYLINKYNLRTEISKDEILEVLENYYGFDGGYFLTKPEANNINLAENYRDNFSLEAWYYGLYLFNCLSD